MGSRNSLKPGKPRRCSKRCSFKLEIRGATNAIRFVIATTVDPQNLDALIEESCKALTLAARQLGVRCHGVMPLNAPSVKVEAVRGYCAQTTRCEPTFIARKAVEDVMKEERRRVAELIQPYDDLRIIAGQGTWQLEFLDQVEELGSKLDILVAPVAGGGILSGCAVAAKKTKSDIVVIRAEPLNANDAAIIPKQTVC